VKYEYLRIGAEAQLRLSEILLGLELGKRFILATGELETDEWFPHVSPDAVDATAFVGYAITPELDLMAGVELTRYFFAMQPQADDLRVAGGAVDQYIEGWVAIAWKLPSSTGGKAE
jgi:hypothetical protein